MKPLHHFIAFGLALASGVTSAQAQSVISRQVTREPVETTITQGPAGTVITRRPLAPAVPAAPAIGAVTVEEGVAPAYDTLGTVRLERPVPPATYVDETVAIAQPDRTVTRARTVAVQRPAATRTVRVTRSASRETTGAGGPIVRHSTVRRTTTRTTVRRTVAAPLVLAPAQRQVIYRTVVQRQIVPSAAAYLAYPTYPPYPARTIVETTGSGYGLGPPPADVYVDDIPPVYASTAVGPAIYPVGARLPMSVVLSPLPETVALRVPSVRYYRTVTLDGRVLLVDPATYTVVADVTP
jgi:Protein of unknown function (DUF1236)